MAACALLTKLLQAHDIRVLPCRLSYLLLCPHVLAVIGLFYGETMLALPLVFHYFSIFWMHQFVEVPTLKLCRVLRTNSLLHARISVSGLLVHRGLLLILLLYLTQAVLSG